jgi:hypothetical protein
MTLEKAAPTVVLSNATCAINDIIAISGVTAFDTSTAIQVACEVLCTYNSAATAGGRLEIYGSVDGTNYTTDPIAVYDLPFTANVTKRAEFSILSAPKYIKPTIRNLDGTAGHTITAVYISLQAQTVA